jgi:hypothetical protein
MKEDYIPTPDDLNTLFCDPAWQWLNSAAEKVSKEETQKALDWQRPNEEKIHASGIAEGIRRFMNEERIREICINLVTQALAAKGETTTKKEITDEYRSG